MNIIKLYPEDTVAVALTDLKKGQTITIGNETIEVLEDIPNAHKIALTDIEKGTNVIKYANSIGIATADIKKGQYVHNHNVATCANSRKDYTYQFDEQRAIFPGKSEKTFLGYERKNGKVGIRNHLLIIPSVFCANGPLQKLAAMVSEKYPKTNNFDGVLALTQPYGCSQTGRDLEITGRILAGVIANANFGGVLVVSNGCEINDLVQLRKYIGEVDESRIKFLVLQDSYDEFADGMALCDEIMKEVSHDKRTPVNISKLHIAMNCGGSDGFSGITANKLLGKVCERFVREGATMNMTEVPEMFGAEHILMNRAASKEIFDDVVDMINNYNDYFQRYGEKVSDNPTQGNIAGGLSTIEDKSLGCIQKGGNCAVMEVLKYGDRATKNGYILVSGPGNDLTGVTGQIAAGAVLTIFTTGRGTPCGFAGPTFRLSSNNKLAERKAGWIDFNAGRMVDTDNEEILKGYEDELYNAILATANGEYRTRTEINGYYQMGILRDGVTL